MATYKEIHGVKVQYRDSDATAIEGDVWYNSNTGLLKMYSAVGAWATGGNLTTGRTKLASSGTQTAGIVYGGGPNSPSTAVVGNAETYDGSSWTEVADLNTDRFTLSGTPAGSQTAAFAIAGSTGSVVDNVESWNGASWTETTDINTAREKAASGGSSTSAIYFGGSSDASESWNGSAWSEVSDLNTPGPELAGFGESNSNALAVGEENTVNRTESWDGSSWTEVGDLNTNRTQAVAFGANNESGVAAGGYAPGSPPLTTNTEEWNGSTWTEVANMPAVKTFAEGIGTNTSGLVAGGSPGGSDATFEWAAAASVQTVTFD